MIKWNSYRNYVGKSKTLFSIECELTLHALGSRVKQMKQKDARIKLMNEVLNGIKVCTRVPKN